MFMREQILSRNIFQTTQMSIEHASLLIVAVGRYWTCFASIDTIDEYAAATGSVKFVIIIQPADEQTRKEFRRIAEGLSKIGSI